MSQIRALPQRSPILSASSWLTCPHSDASVARGITRRRGARTAAANSSATIRASTTRIAEATRSCGSEWGWGGMWFMMDVNINRY